MNKQIQNTLHILHDKGVILYPTDTVWGLGCDATNEIAVHKIYQIKNRDESKSLVILVDSIGMLKNYVDNIPETAMQVLEDASKPTTIIYNNPKGLASNLIAKDNTVAIRIVQDDFCQKLIKKFNKPIVSTSANISERATPECFEEIALPVLNAVDYVVNLRRQERMKTPSRIIRILKGGTLEVIRE